MISRKELSYENRDRVTPPGTVQMDSNLFVDVTENANLDYREYLNWLAHVFGEKTVQYQSALPDASVWNNEHWYSQKYEAQHYLYNPEYQHHPLVGITQDQARAYCKWRSDRVFERMLILDKKIDALTNQDSLTYFSIQRYFEGMYVVKPDPAVQFYPSYRLPTAGEWKRARNHFNASFPNDRRQDEQFQLQSSRDTIIDLIIEKAYTKNKRRKERNGFHYDDNVREWVAEDNQTMGASWKDGTVDHDHANSKTTVGANAYTGMRAVCEWKKRSIRN